MKTYSIVILTDNHTDVFKQLNELPEAKLKLRDKSNIPTEHGIQHICYHYQDEKRLLFWIISSNNKYFINNVKAHLYAAQECIFMYRFNEQIDGKMDPLPKLKEAYNKWNDSPEEVLIFNLSHQTNKQWFHQFILDFSKDIPTFYANYAAALFSKNDSEKMIADEKDVKDLTFEEVFENTRRIAEKQVNKFK